MKNNKIFIFLLLIPLFLFAACGNEKLDGNGNDEVAFPSQFYGLINDKKVYITSIGQSIESENFIRYTSNVFTSDYTYNMTLKAEEVEEDSVVFIFIGCSIKGLQSSELTVESEIQRAKDFGTLTDEKNVTIVAWHIGGSPRRGSTSDSLFDYVIKKSDLLIFTKDGNIDGYLKSSSTFYNVPYYQIDSMSSVTIPLKLLINGEE